MTTARSRDRAAGAFWGLALGDALGMPTQELSAVRAREVLGPHPRLVAGPPDNPIGAGLPAGTVTDDTEQAVLLAALLVQGSGQLDPHAFARELLAWQGRMAARGSLDLLGPTTRRALSAIERGVDPSRTGLGGHTNGAAMRITPVGIATPAHPPDLLAAAVTAADRPTHDSPPAHAAAAAVAAVVSLGLDGADFETAWPQALDVATLAGATVPADGGAGKARRPVDEGGGPDVPALIEAAVLMARDAASTAGLEAALDLVRERVGVSLESHESIPAAFAVAALAPADPWQTGWLAARLGGDADTIAAMAAAMVGACCGLSSMPADALATVRAVNTVRVPGVAGDLPLGDAVDRLVDALLDLRAARP